MDVCRNVNEKSKKTNLRYSKYVSLVMLFCSVFLMGDMLTGCGKKQELIESRECHIVFEDNDAYMIDQPAQTVNSGADVEYILTMKDGYAIKSVDYPDSEVQTQTAGSTTKVILKDVQYSVTVKAEVIQSDVKISYYANGGIRMDGEDEAAAVTITAWDTHIRINTSIGTDVFTRDGYTLIGWNTMPDGSGTAVSLGSRIEVTDGLCLYAQWSKWTEASCFTYEVTGGNAVITGYTGNNTGKSMPTELSIPAEIEGKPVIAIGKGAFAKANFDTVVLPLTLQNISDDAFVGAQMRTIYMYDNIGTFDDYSFRDCENLKTLHINAVEQPVYSDNYFGTFADKYDRLLSLKDEKKIVLFSGSSTRFGYDSEMLEQAFPEYKVVNMGVFAYTNATPQLMLILDCMNEGDILIDAPEFDAAKRQFCTTNDMDDSFFCMVEANYDILAELDLRMFQKTFSSFHSYLTVKSGMEAKAYGMTPAEYDEDGNPVSEKSYNAYGDYILYRQNAKDDTPIYGLEVPYTKEAFPKETYIDSVNEMYQRFLDKNISVYFTYAPRNNEAISVDSTLEKQQELDEYFKEELIVPVISDMEESLYPGKYLFGTDNHLSTEGVEIRTQRIISDLTRQREKEEQVNE